VKHLLSCLACILALPTLAFPPVVLADGGGPTRKLTAAEAAAYNQVRNTLRGALPKAPSDYTFTFAFDGDGEEGLLPAGIQPGQMFPVQYTARYILSQGLSDQQAQTLVMDRAKGTPEQQARLAGLDAKDAELTKARDKTRDRAEDRKSVV
jgi:hypothetical protein